MPLPLISAMPPSALSRSISASAPSAPGFDRRSGRRHRCRGGGRRARRPASRPTPGAPARRATTTRGSRCRWRAASTSRTVGHALQLARRAGRTEHGFSGAPNHWTRGSRRNHMRWRRANCRVRTTTAVERGVERRLLPRQVAEDLPVPDGLRGGAGQRAAGLRGAATSSTRPASRIAATRALDPLGEDRARQPRRRRCGPGTRWARTPGARCRTTRTADR